MNFSNMLLQDWEIAWIYRWWSSLSCMGTDEYWINVVKFTCHLKMGWKANRKQRARGANSEHHHTAVCKACSGDVSHLRIILSFQWKSTSSTHLINKIMKSLEVLGSPVFRYKAISNVFTSLHTCNFRRSCSIKNKTIYLPIITV